MKTKEQTKQKLAQWYGHTAATGSQYSQGFKVGMISALEWMLSDDSGTQGVDEGYGPREASR